ncbi:MAG: GMC family oxidoreductase [Chloroflexi bacterium]|nr:GMC family oxidoreductase [Chloroflexota bacterium]
MMTQYPSSADTIVIGGGTAGAAVAGRLAMLGNQSVLLLEAGPDYGALKDGRWPADLLDGRVVASTHDWGYTSAARTGQPDHQLHRARVIGGCSAHNGCIALWGSRADYDGWVDSGNPGWSTDEVVPFFERAAIALRVRRFAPTEITPFHAACLDAMVCAGIPLVDDLNSLDKNVGAGTAPVNILDGVRWNTALSYIDPERNNRHLTVLGDTFVDKMNVVNDHAVSVDVIRPGGAARIAAGRIIICAGSYGSPAILLRSGIGPAGELQHLGIKTVLDLAGVGRNLHDHPAISLRFGGTELLSARMEAFVTAGHIPFTEQSLAKARSAGCADAFDLHVYPTIAPNPNQDGRWDCSISVANMTPQSRGSVRLRSSDPTAAPIIDTGYLSDPDDADLGVLMSGIDLARQIAIQRPLVDLIGDELPISATCVSPEAVRRSCRHYYHPVGTCKMGPTSDSEAVVDSLGRVRGLANVYVADASIMPAIPRANTNLPALMVAERIVEWLA